MNTGENLLKTKAVNSDGSSTSQILVYVRHLMLAESTEWIRKNSQIITILTAHLSQMILNKYKHGLVAKLDLDSALLGRHYGEHLCFSSTVVNNIKKTRLLPDLKLSKIVLDHSLFKLCTFHEKINGNFLLELEMCFIMPNIKVIVSFVMPFPKDLHVGLPFLTLSLPGLDDTILIFCHRHHSP